MSQLRGFVRETTRRAFGPRVIRSLRRVLAGLRRPFPLALAAAVLALGCRDHRGTPSRAIEVAFRFDDYSSRSPTRLDVSLIRDFAARGLTLTAVGVIPAAGASDSHDPAAPPDPIPLTPEKAAILRAAVAEGSVDVALHGYSHHTIHTVRGYSEFSGLDYDTQRLRISEGKKLSGGASRRRESRHSFRPGTRTMQQR